MNYLKELAKQGFLVEPSVASKIEKISEDEFNFILSELKKQNLFVVNAAIFDKIFQPEAKIINKFEPVAKFSVQDYVSLLNRRYDFIQKILVKKIELTNLLSINKIGFGKVSIIGFVKEKNEKEENTILTIEDQTGEINIVAPKPLVSKVSLDDVIAVSGNINNKIFFAEKILFPDIPLSEPKYSSEHIKIAFSEKDVKADYVISGKSIKNLSKNKTQKFSEPVLLDISGIIILVALDLDPQDILRRRFIHKQNNDFLINPVPDIIFNNKGVNSNYKGTTILHEDCLVDLSNRETTRL